jgi:hypothetical protein
MSSSILFVFTTFAILMVANVESCGFPMPMAPPAPTCCAAPPPPVLLFKKKP